MVGPVPLHGSDIQEVSDPSPLRRQKAGDQVFTPLQGDTAPPPPSPHLCLYLLGRCRGPQGPVTPPPLPPSLSHCGSDQRKRAAAILRNVQHNLAAAAAKSNTSPVFYGRRPSRGGAPFGGAFSAGGEAPSGGACWFCRTASGPEANRGLIYGAITRRSFMSEQQREIRDGCSRQRGDLESPPPPASRPRRPIRQQEAAGYATARPCGVLNVLQLKADPHTSFLSSPDWCLRPDSKTNCQRPAGRPSPNPHMAGQRDQDLFFCRVIKEQSGHHHRRGGGVPQGGGARPPSHWGPVPLAGGQGPRKGTGPQCDGFALRGQLSYEPVPPVLRCSNTPPSLLCPGIQTSTLLHGSDPPCALGSELWDSPRPPNLQTGNSPSVQPIPLPGAPLIPSCSSKVRVQKNANSSHSIKPAQASAAATHSHHAHGGGGGALGGAPAPQALKTKASSTTEEEEEVPSQDAERPRASGPRSGDGGTGGGANMG
ncbi:unnamed protein product [Gadus morhua 'NCC']